MTLQRRERQAGGRALATLVGTLSTDSDGGRAEQRRAGQGWATGGGVGVGVGGEGDQVGSHRVGVVYVLRR